VTLYRGGTRRPESLQRRAQGKEKEKKSDRKGEQKEDQLHEGSKRRRFCRREGERWIKGLGQPANRRDTYANNQGKPNNELKVAQKAIIGRGRRTGNCLRNTRNVKLGKGGEVCFRV